MAFTVQQKLKLINIVCQTYVFTFSFLTIGLFVNVTLPAATGGDQDTLRLQTFLMYFIYVNIWGNYLSVWYKSRLSVMKPDSSKSMSYPVYSPLSIKFSHNKLTNVSNFPTAVSRDIDNNSCQSRKDCCNVKIKGLITDTYTIKEHEKCLTYADSSFESQLLNVECENNPNNNECKLCSGFSYNNNCEHYSHDCGGELSRKDEDRELYLTSPEPILVLAGWTRCKDCNMSVPPRAKHCPLCGHCVLKRDHHCFFMGCCVGFHNQRFFIIFCLYAAIGGIYSTVVTLVYLRASFEASHTWGYLAYLFPVVLYLWLTGAASWSMVGMVIYLYWAIITALVCCYYFCVQIFLVCRGQTKYECLKWIKTYQGTVYKNVTSVFGRLWPIGFILPAPFLGYHHDGIDWAELVSDNKIF